MSKLQFLNFHAIITLEDTHFVQE